MNLLHLAESAMQSLVSVGILVLEFMGVLIIFLSAIKAIISYFTKREDMRLNLAQGMALALEFKLGGEILRTVIVREWSEIAIVGSIILLRGILNFLIHWEIEKEEKKKH